MSAATSAEHCSWKGEQDMCQTKQGHSTSPKVVTKKGKRSSVLKMANNLVGQGKKTDFNTNHTREALKKVNGRSKLASSKDWTSWVAGTSTTQQTRAMHLGGCMGFHWLRVQENIWCHAWVKNSTLCLRSTVSQKEEYARLLRLQCDVSLHKGRKEVRVANNQPVDPRELVRHTACSLVNYLTTYHVRQKRWICCLIPSIFKAE